MIDFLTHHFFVVGNARQEFENAGSKIGAFVDARLDAHLAPHEHCENWSAVERRVREVLRDRPGRIGYIVITDLMNPFTDMALVSRMTERIERTHAAFCLCEGAVPGTEVRAVMSVEALCEKLGEENFSLESLEREKAPIVRWKTQSRYNNQLNLYKYKRLKMFLALTGKVSGLHEMTIPQLMDTLSRDDVFSMLAAFGDELRQIQYIVCPHCEGNLNSLQNTMSQPFCGYLPSDRPLYHECESCGLVIQSPSVHEDDVSRIYDKWDKQDFVASTNNPYTKQSIRCDFDKIIDHLPRQARSLDLGGGVGNFSRFLRSEYPGWDVTHSDFEIKSGASDGIRSRTLDFTRKSIGTEQYDLITAWEVIEHVPYEKLDYVLQNIGDALVPGGFFVFSTPDFDSPLCKSFDFYALCPPFHYLVFGESWLRSYLSKSESFEIFDVKHCSDFLDDALNWYAYGSSTCPSMAVRATSKVLQTIFEFDRDKKIRNQLAAAGMGTEVIMVLRKKAISG